MTLCSLLVRFCPFSVLCVGNKSKRKQIINFHKIFIICRLSISIERVTMNYNMIIRVHYSKLILMRWDGHREKSIQKRISFLSLPYQLSQFWMMMSKSYLRFSFNVSSINENQCIQFTHLDFSIYFICINFSYRKNDDNVTKWCATSCIFNQNISWSQ